ncbi:TetR/AcrR family transcriptional regulator [Dyadobacter sp. CY356]|uniref:TetR/AcrR family transcriptional regulator n=1 Tax=Dyadobacter sp. CY356 TaxID=2906442 RepID=UPI001F32761B|nr:TetR/AcrR family transcriptional regulator [Dyadobacter sp. CY356]MCF0054944.1 TetR/AcrR family transcriptional regulator [Dyadobacter sp. CY356]
MAVRDTGAEQKIKDSAKKMFFSEGKLHATTQDIADAAGVNRTLLNYYFRTREILFETVFKEAMQEMGVKLDSVFLSKTPFYEKIEMFIDVFTAEITAYPYREIFLITEIHRQDVKHLNTGPGHSQIFKTFFVEVQSAIDGGILRASTTPLNFTMNLFSIMAYPVIMEPLYRNMFDLNAEQFAENLKTRKAEILDMLFK